MAAKFDLPEGEVNNLLVERLTDKALTPDRPVICLNRGREPLYETFDGQHLEIPAGLFRMEYGAAVHCQRKLIVKGTRNLEVGGYVSWIAILGSEDREIPVDPTEDCVPFTDAQLQTFGERLEGIDRSALSDPAARDAKPISTSIARAASRGQGASMRPSVDASTQASALAEEAAAHVFDRVDPAELAAHQDEAAAAGAGVGAEPGRVPGGRRRS